MKPALLACAALLASPAARAEPGRTAAAFLQRPLGARAAGMGGAFAAVRGSLDSAQYNPAAIATVPRRTLASTYLSGFDGANHGFLAYAHPFPFGTVGASVLYYNAGGIDLSLSDGTTGRVTAEEDSAWALSYSLALAKSLYVGALYRFVRMELAETASASSSQGDFGVLWRTPLRGLSLGAAYQYLGPDIRFEEVGDPPPRTLRYGLAFHFPDVEISAADPSVDLEAFDMTLAADVAQTLHEEVSPRMGAELGLTPSYMTRVALRAGWVFGRDSESFTFGMGLRQGRLGLDYALGKGKDLGNLQQFSLTIDF